MSDETMTEPEPTRTATNELRRMLDERGVEHADHDPRPGCENPWSTKVTEWHNGSKRPVRYQEWPNGTTRLDAGGVSAEQAIEATLGRGECHDEGGTDANGQQVFNCSACGCVLSLYDREGLNTLMTSFICDYPRYCPECGRKVAK